MIEDIEKKNFSRVLRGFSPEEVDDFLDRIILDMTDLIAQKEALEAENAELRDEINKLHEELTYLRLKSCPSCGIKVENEELRDRIDELLKGAWE